jgi:hypothetical protein
MKNNSPKVDSTIKDIKDDHQEAISKLVDIFRKNLPDGFQEGMQYDMISFFVPHDVYPKGYHVDSNQPLPFISIGSQKNHISIYHMGLYMDKDLNDWFVSAYQSLNLNKLDMGKSCIRFKNPNKIPFDLIRELSRKMSVKAYINYYEESQR